jgi:hypothetical protein
MATSGTVATTVIDTAKVIEHAIRRCKLPTNVQTPEIIQAATESLYILLLSLSNRGLNLWAIEKQIFGTTTGQSIYVTNPGTIDVLNVVYSQPNRITGVDTTTATTANTALAQSSAIVRVGIKMSSVSASDTFTMSNSIDNSTYNTIYTTTKTNWAANTWYWFDIPRPTTGLYYRFAFGNAVTFTDYRLAISVYDLPITPWSRDTWVAINNKNQTGQPSTTYFYEKLLTPQITVWPVPTSDTNQIAMWCQRQIQDVGTLTQQIEMPQRWYESLIWQTALRVGFEYPQMDEARLQEISQICEKYTIEAEREESDGMPIYLQPRISAYTR